MKRLALVFCSLLIFGPASARAAEPGKSIEGTVTKKKEEKDPFHGFNLRIGLRATTGVNFEPEAGYLNLG
ncbi:MAG: hypothetical protein RBU30_18900, partial [Polyangia bacterium]|nr:hypothetical protein [Polyangia bacterium]